MSRFVVGVDLGTTHTVVAFADADAEDARVEILRISQLVGLGQIDAEPILPSCVYIPTDGEREGDATRLPWGEPDQVVGQFARTHGAKVPQRLVLSSKSWLCHRGIDPHEPLLPWQHPAEVSGLSPVQACSALLDHVVSAWNHAHPDDLLADQEVLLTVPASFDSVARELTLEAAAAAGITDPVLLEEPQAAFYAWLHDQGDAWRDHVEAGQVCLVCDVGGGTTDFTLIGARDDSGSLELERLAVGNHLLLGGDNMDLALAHRVAQRMGGALDAWQSQSLWLACRQAKELLLTDLDRDRVAVTVAGRGSSLIGGQIRGELLREDIDTLIVDGFLPPCTADAKPRENPRIGLQAQGLPFADDPRISHHLAAFLAAHKRIRKPARVLFNGGVMQAHVLRNRIIELLSEWSGEAVGALVADETATAVACGAAYYGLVRRGKGIRIRGGSPRTYYVGYEEAMPAIPGMKPPLTAVCVVPFGMEEGSHCQVPSSGLVLVTGASVRFQLFASTVRKQDELGATLPGSSKDLVSLAPLEVALDVDDGAPQVPVTLHSKLTEIGTLELFCVAKDESRHWKLELNLRSEVPVD